MVAFPQPADPPSPPSQPTQRRPFNALPPAVRTRLVRALGETSERGGPALASRRSAVLEFWGSIVLAALTLGGLGWLASVDFGRNTIEGLHHPPLLLAVGYLPLALLLASLLHGAGRSWRDRQRLPTARGHYLFPMDLVELTRDDVVVTPLTGLRDYQLTHYTTNGVYTRTEVVLRFEGKRTAQLTLRGRETAERGFRQWQQRRQLCLAAFRLAREQGENTAEAAALLALEDPLIAIEIAGGWAGVPMEPPIQRDDPEAPWLPPYTGWLAWDWKRIALAGIVLALLAWTGRNLLSDAACWSSEEQAHTHDVTIAEAWRTLDPEQSHPSLDTRAGQYQSNGGWVHRATAARRIPEQAWELARAHHRAAIYREFLRRHGAERPDLAAGARDAIQLLYAEARQQLARQLAQPLPALAPTNDQAWAPDPNSADDARLGAIVGRLLDWAEAHDDARVAVSFIEPEPQQLQASDARMAELVTHSPEMAANYGTGLHYPPLTPFFGPRDQLRRQGQLLASLQSTLHVLFPTDVLTVERAASPPRDRPVLLIAQEVELVPRFFLGACWLEEEKRTCTMAFPGVQIDFNGGFSLPGDTSPALEFVATVAPPDEFSVRYSQYRSPYLSQLTGNGPTPGLVYDTMVQRAFDRFGAYVRRRFHLATEPAAAPEASP